MTVTVEGKRVLVTGGTGSLGQRIVRRLLSGDVGQPSQVIVLSRDEAKQHDMRLRFLNQSTATDDVIFKQGRGRLTFRIGDVRDFSTMVETVRESDIIIHAAALKQVPTCEYFSREAVLTNVTGADVLVRAVHAAGKHVEAVVGISTDKACKPVNVMGMTKALMERLLIAANLGGRPTRFVCVRYANVIASRGSVVPLFLDQIARGGPVTITTKEMTRFLLSIDGAADAIFSAIANARPGEIYVSKAPAARVVDIAHALIDGRRIEVEYIGIRPGEKIHEIMVSEEELPRTFERDGYYVIAPLLPELQPEPVKTQALDVEYSSAQVTMTLADVKQMLNRSLELVPA
jgi:UDP-glucose 4-epimerase